MKHIANILTGLRMILAPIAGFCLWRGGLSPLPQPETPIYAEPQWTMTALILIITAAVTDLLDGAIARALNTQSAIGRLMDPLADKMLCWSILLALTLVSGGNIAIALPMILIVMRDIIISVRRLTGATATTPSRIAKYKTALEMIALTTAPALALTGASAPWSALWLCALVGCSGLSLWTGFSYLRRS